jgi:hypothetical protein
MLTLELYKIKKELVDVDSLEKLQSIISRFDTLEGYVNSSKIEITKDCENFSFEIEKVRARIEKLLHDFKENKE